MLRSYTSSGHIIIDLQTFVKDSIPLNDIVAMVRDALQDIKTDCTWMVHLVWEHTDDDRMNLIDHMWGSEDEPTADDDMSVDHSRDSEAEEVVPARRKLE